VKFHFNQSRLRKQRFCWKFNRKFSNFKIQGAWPLNPSFDTHGWVSNTVKLAQKKKRLWRVLSPWLWESECYANNYHLYKLLETAAAHSDFTKFLRWPLLSDK